MEKEALTPSDYAFGRTTWIELAKKWGHLPDLQRIEFGFIEDGKEVRIVRHAYEIKARALAESEVQNG